MSREEYRFRDFLIFISPIIISLLFYSYREGWICRTFRIKPEMSRIYNEIIYIKDQYLHGVYDVWQFPEDTLERGAGDCEDLAILLAVRIVEKTGLPAMIVTGYGGYVTHAWVYFEGWYYDPAANIAVRPKKYFKEFEDIRYHTLDYSIMRCFEDTVIY